MDRILILLTAPSWPDAAEALRSAKSTAAAPERITYGVSLEEAPSDDDLEAMRLQGATQYLCPASSPWQEVESLWRGEGFILMGHMAMRFTRHWDMQLLHALHKCRREGLMQNVLTGYLPRPSDPVDAVFPVAAEGFDPEGRLCFHRGTALRYAAEPLRSAFIHPDFCFAAAGFFRDMARPSGLPLFLRAYQNKWKVYTLHKPLLHMMWDIPLQPETVCAQGEDATALTRFETRFSLKIQERKLSAMARQGVFSMDLRFRQHVPVTVQTQEALREWQNRRSKVNPLCVTAFLSNPPPEESLRDELMSWFHRLARLKNISLLAYGDAPCLRQLTAIHPNALEYKPRYGLMVEGALQPEEEMRYVRLCKPFLLAQSREKMLGHSHYIWLDFGYLRFPVYEGASVGWDELCTDQIAMARVDGEIDPSMIVMPQKEVLPLCREITALCHAVRQQEGRLPEEKTLWHMLMKNHPGLFRLIDLPGKRELLTLALTSREEEFHAHS